MHRLQEEGRGGRQRTSAPLTSYLSLNKRGAENRGGCGGAVWHFLSRVRFSGFSVVVGSCGWAGGGLAQPLQLSLSPCLFLFFFAASAGRGRGRWRNGWQCLAGGAGGEEGE